MIIVGVRIILLRIRIVMVRIRIIIVIIKILRIIRDDLCTYDGSLKVDGPLIRVLIFSRDCFLGKRHF